MLDASIRPELIPLSRLLKPGFHYSSWRPELTGDWFPLPVNTGRVDWRAVSTSRVDGPSTRLQKFYSIFIIGCYVIIRKKVKMAKKQHLEPFGVDIYSISCQLCRQLCNSNIALAILFCDIRTASAFWVTEHKYKYHDSIGDTKIYSFRKQLKTFLFSGSCHA